MRSAVGLVLIVPVLLAACGHETGELAAQDDILRTGYDPLPTPEGTSPPPVRQTVVIGGSDRDAGSAQIPEEVIPPRASEDPAYSSDAPVPGACPMQCWVAEPHHPRPITAEELERLRIALGPTLDGLRHCMAGWGRRRHPILNLRFNRAGDLLDEGVDTTGFEGSAEECMQALVRGNVSPPNVKFEGPATVRCTERCEPAARPPRKRR